MPKIPVKLSRGEIVVPPQAYQQFRDRLEGMNKEGLLARNMGGVAAYRANGGAVYRQTGGAIDPLASARKEDERRRRSQFGAGLVHIGSNDFIGASDALAHKESYEYQADKAQAEELSTDGSSVSLTQQMIQLLTDANPHLAGGG